jgi:hypothetical protein
VSWTVKQFTHLCFPAVFAGKFGWMPKPVGKSRSRRPTGKSGRRISRIVRTYGPMTMPNDQNNRPGFFERVTVRFLIVAIIVVAFLAMVLHLL